MFYSSLTYFSCLHSPIGLFFHLNTMKTMYHLCQQTHRFSLFYYLRKQITEKNMADNYLEKQYESYLARKAAMSKGLKKKKTVGKRQDIDEEAVDALKELIKQPSIEVPYNIFRNNLYNADDLYAGYRLGEPDSYAHCYDYKVYQYYLRTGKTAFKIKETLARTLHDHAMSNALNDFLKTIDEKRVVGIMGGHGLLRTESAYRDIVLVSKQLTENGCLMISGGGPGAMEATHLGAWMAGRSHEETIHVLAMLQEAPSFKDKLWLETAFQVMKNYPHPTYQSLGIPTWLYGHEPATPFATHIAKYFDNSIREDSILTFAKGGIIYAPGSAGTMQEIFQEAVQNHYLSFGYASPMIFMNSNYWTEEMPVYPLMQHLITKEKYKNLLLTLSDATDEIVKTILDFRNKA